MRQVPAVRKDTSHTGILRRRTSATIISFLKPVAGILLMISCLSVTELPAQNSRRVQSMPDGENAYGSKFFDQLRSIFGKFQDSDLQRVFQQAKPIECSELVGRKGEWRPVAFFNENRKLGDWCRENLEEVKNDLSVYSFKGECKGSQSSLQVATEFPIEESMEAYNQGRVELEQVDVNVNFPVSVAFNTRTMAYTFNLPFLFQIERKGNNALYSFIAPSRRSAYAREVSSRWECKGVSSRDVTYRFMICRTHTVPSGPAPRGQTYEPSFGALAYFILSDGTEAQTSVNLSFEGTSVSVKVGSETIPSPEPSTAPEKVIQPEPVPQPSSDIAKPALSRTSRGRNSAVWRIPSPAAKLAEETGSEFRLRFSRQSWTGKIALPQLLAGQKLSGLIENLPPDGADSCVWRPGNLQKVSLLIAEPPYDDLLFSVETAPGGGTPATISFDVRTRGGDRLGSLQCRFRKAAAPAEVSVDQWNAIVGPNLTLETH
jgi:hypothetical protein